MRIACVSGLIELCLFLFVGSVISLARCLAAEQDPPMALPQQ